MRWCFDGSTVLQLDLRGLGLDSTHRTEQTILLLGAVEDCYGRSDRDTRILRLRGRNERQDSSPQHKSRQKPPHNTIHLDSFSSNSDGAKRTRGGRAQKMYK